MECLGSVGCLRTGVMPSRGCVLIEIDIYILYWGIVHIYELNRWRLRITKLTTPKDRFYYIFMLMSNYRESGKFRIVLQTEESPEEMPPLLAVWWQSASLKDNAEDKLETCVKGTADEIWQLIECGQREVTKITSIFKTKQLGAQWCNKQDKKHEKSKQTYREKMGIKLNLWTGGNSSGVNGNSNIWMVR